MEAYKCRWRFLDDLQYDWLIMMPLGGAVVSFYHVTSFVEKVKLSARALDKA